MPKEEEILRAEAARLKQLQLYLEAHNTSRATSEQLVRIFDLGLDEEDRERLIDWIEEPRGLYPEESQTLFECALDLVRSERK